jgi:hypothetical protein
MNNNDNFVDDNRSLQDWLKNVNILLLCVLIIILFFIIYTVHLFSKKSGNKI